jgi:hypothetical protein
MALTGRRLASPGSVLSLLGTAHAVWGLVAYRDPLRDIARAGVVGTVGDGIFDTAHDRDGRAAGFWFMFAAPVLVSYGRLAEAALRARDTRAVRSAGRAVLGLGLVGSAVIPRSGFPVAVPVGYWLLRRASAIDVTGTEERGGRR